MTRTDSARSARLAFAVALTLASACSGDTGPKGDQGDQGDQGDGGTQGPTGPVALTAESCVVCHAAGNTADDLAAHAARKNQSLARNVATITSVTIPGAAGGGGTPTVLFSVTDSTTSAPVTGLTSFAFAIARLEPDAALGIASWKSYVNRNYATAPAISIGGTTISSTGTAAMKAACSEVTPPSGNYTCLLRTVPAGTSAFLAATVRDPASYTSTSAAVTVAYDPQYKIRVALQSGAPIPGGTVTTTPATPPFDATFDFDPAAGDTQTTPAAADLRQLVRTENCNACHQKLAAHGGRRLSVPYCVTCHNPSSGDPVGTTVDFKVMVHKLHMGKDLPSVLAGGTYVIKSSFGDADFSDVAFPQDVANCLACHGQPATVTGTPPSTTLTLGTAPTLGDNYKTKPTTVTCTSCHDRTSFAEPLAPGYTLHKGGTANGGAAYVDADCATCHTKDGSVASAPIELFHAIPAAVDFKYSIVGVTGTAPGETPAVTVLVTNAAGTTPNKLNASGGNAADVPWAQTSTGASRLAVDIGWSTTVVTSAGDTNYTNDGSGQKAGQPVSLDVLKNGVYNSADGSYTVTSTVAIPANAVGAGIVALEGHPADAQGNRIAVKSATAPFAITGTAAARRSVVDINKCNLCHQNLSLHGNNRTSSIETCVICHNTNATDISRRPTDGTATADGKAEESVDFKRLIHGIHGASFSGAGPVIYGFGSSANDFSKAGYPGYLYNCEACHNAGTYSSTAFVPENGTTTSTSGDPLTPAGFLRTTKITATCSSCHASVPDRGHMEANGGALGVTQAQIDAVNQ